MTDKQQPTVLLVEDNAHVLALNQSVLERRGYSVLTARSLAAVQKAQGGRGGFGHPTA